MTYIIILLFFVAVIQTDYATHNNKQLKGSNCKSQIHHFLNFREMKNKIILLFFLLQIFKLIIPFTLIQFFEF